MTEFEMIRAGMGVKAVMKPVEPLNEQDRIEGGTGEAYRVAGQKDPRPTLRVTRARLAAGAIQQIAERWDCTAAQTCFLLSLCLKVPADQIAEYAENGVPDDMLRHWCRTVEHLEQYSPKMWRPIDDADIPSEDEE